MNTNLQIRWMIRRDMAEVLRIEKTSFESPWWEEDFLRCLRQRNCIGMVAELDHAILGFMIYELHKSKLWILNFAVNPAERLHGVGRQMVNRLIDKLSQQRRSKIMLAIRETNLSAQLFFRNQGFRAVRILHDCCGEAGEDAYEMEFKLAGSKDYSSSYSPYQVTTNRISEYVAR